VLGELQDFFNSSNYNQSYQQTLSSLRNTYERIEQHQLDMEFLRQQFEKLNEPTDRPVPTVRPSATDYRSPWPNPPSLHFSSFGGGGAEAAHSLDPDGRLTSHQQSIDKSLFQKETQTETSLFDDPFKASIQQYSLFGGDDANEPGGGGEFNFNPVLEPTSPGVVGDRSFTHQQQEEDVAEMFPYRLRVSEYNPISYQGKALFTRDRLIGTQPLVRININYFTWLVAKW